MQEPEHRDPSDPYASGAYFADRQRFAADAGFKADCFMPLFRRFAEHHAIPVRSLVDVGCGCGEVVAQVAQRLRDAGHDLTLVKGYDVSPHVAELARDGIEFVHGDFLDSHEEVDLVTLFDVVEHVPAPIDFLRRVAQRCRVVVLHIPLENSLSLSLRDRYRAKLADPGHIYFADAPAALNLCTLAGLRVVDYDYTRGFLAPSGRSSLAAKLALPLRLGLATLSPYVASKWLGGMSLLVIALTPSASRT